jgi:MFS family permease
MLVQALTLAVLTATGLIQLPLLYVLAAVQGLMLALDNPTRQAFVVELVGHNDLANAVALNSAQFNLARLIGPALGGLTIAAIGVAGCFFVNAGSFLAVLGALLLMRPDRFHASAPAARGNMLSQIREGVRYALRTPDIALVLLLMAVLGTFGYNFSVVLPLLAKYVLHSGPLGFGLLTSAMGIGSLLAALSLAYSGRVTRRTLLAGALAFSVLLLGLAFAQWWLVALPLTAALGAASILFTATANTRLQLVTEPALRGRVMSIYMLLFSGTTPIGSLVVGYVADHGGVSVAVAGMALVCLAGVAGALFFLRASRSRMLSDATLLGGSRRPQSAAPREALARS